MLFLHYQIIRYNITWLEHRKRTLFYRERRHQYLSQRPRHCRPGPGIQISPTLCVLICPLAWNTADCARKFSLPLRTWEVRRQRWDVFGFPRGDLTYPEDLSVRGRRRQLLMLPWDPRAPGRLRTDSGHPRSEANVGTGHLVQQQAGRDVHLVVLEHEVLLNRDRLAWWTGPDVSAQCTLYSNKYKWKDFQRDHREFLTETKASICVAGWYIRVSMYDKHVEYRLYCRVMVLNQEMWITRLTVWWPWQDRETNKNFFHLPDWNFEI